MKTLIHHIMIKFNKLINFLLNNIEVWWCRNDNIFNFGDELNPYIISKLTGKKIKRAGSLWNRFELRKKYLAIGSIIEKANKNTIVWGAGIIVRDQDLRHSIYTAVRGPLTQKRMTECGLTPPNVVGDPALLLPCFYKPKPTTKYKYGVIPHIIDYHLIKDKFQGNSDVIVVDFTSDIEETIDIIASCELLYSSSLHGIITANAYLKPAIWCGFSNNLSGDDVKFYDYILSVEENEKTEKLEIDVNSLSFESLSNYQKKASFIHPKEEIITKIQNNLIKSSPF